MATELAYYKNHQRDALADAKSDAVVREMVLALNTRQAGVKFSNGQFLTFNPFMDAKSFGAAGDDSTNDTAALQAAIATGADVFIPPGTYRIDAALVLNSNQSIILTPSTVIKQTTANTNIFKATQKNNVWIHGNGAILWGEGTYEGDYESDGTTVNPDRWTGNESHEDRGIQFIGCTQSGITCTIIKRCGNGGIVIEGGNGILIACVTVEGTHTHGNALLADFNFQNGIHIRNSIDATIIAAGLHVVKNVRVIDADISGTAQGFLMEDYGYGDLNEGIVLSNILIHDIPGQHGMYIQCSGVTVNGYTGHDIAQIGLKIQSGSHNKALSKYHLAGLNLYDLGNTRCGGGHGVELSTLGSGSISDVKLYGQIRNCQRGLIINKNISRVQGDIQIRECPATVASLTGPTTAPLSVTPGSTSGSSGVVIQGDGVTDIDLRVMGKTISRNGIEITATNSKRIRIRPHLVDCGLETAATYHGILLESATALEVDIFDPVILDSTGQTVNGVFNSNAGCTLGVYGSAIITGSSSYGLRTASTLAAWPMFYTVTATTSPFHDDSLVLTKFTTARILESTTGIQSKADMGMDTPSGSPTNRDFEWRTSGVDRWAIRVSNEAESGSDAGSNLSLRAYDDTGTLIDEVLTVNRKANEQLSLNRNVRILNKSLTIRGAAASSRDLKFDTGGTDRWILRVNSDAESGSDAGSNLVINARADDGSSIDEVLTVARASGGVLTVGRPLRVASTIEMASGGPTISSGSGVPGSSVPNGSIYLRTDGTGPNLYVRENGAWVAK